jgi:uncharacterized protein (DUF58 family)
MASPERYLRPDVIRQVARLDLRARFIVEGFLAGLHASPFQGFSVEFSEHRRYVPGDDLKDLDWGVYARTDKYYLRKYQAETNLVGHLALDLSGSMGYTYRQDLTKFDYCVCLAAALGYLMIHQQDPVGLVAFDTQIKTSLPPRSRRSHLATMLSVLSGLKPEGPSDIGASLHQLAALAQGRGLVMLFSDLLADPEPILAGLHHLRHRGHEVIVFHVLDEAEAHFPFDGVVALTDPETGERVPDVDARDERAGYLAELEAFRSAFREDCARAGIDYVAMDTSINFDKALLEYLQQRQRRF